MSLVYWIRPVCVRKLKHNAYLNWMFKVPLMFLRATYFYAPCGHLGQKCEIFWMTKSYSQLPLDLISIFHFVIFLYFLPATLMASVDEISECRPKFWSMVTEDVVKRCAAFLTQVNDIPRLYRRTNKEVSR